MTRAGYRIPSRATAAALLCVALAACEAPVPVSAPLVRPPVKPAPPAPPPPPSAASEAARAYYAAVQAQLLGQGLLRTDGGGPDTPYTDRMLAENFLQVALFDEYRRGPDGLQSGVTESRLRRWAGPVRVGLRFGASVPADRQATDRARVASYLARLSQITGHPIALSDSSPNFFLSIVNEDERRALGPQVTAALRNIAPADVAGITDMPRSTYCLVYAMSEAGSGTYNRAYAVVRAEHPDLLRLSCLHEELAQGLGLANDSPRARPSIFNDDEEFALLTTQDELMLKMLYDPRLRPGMTLEEARPVVVEMARELLGGES
ncbi:DUF2927 domain-containing protein [Fertoebacter nigrum]|uniref:DUF2927 domain-containing protein n=1 Tax=Fertoeibacter niger TaxID=2656921 RepID=A0A8X8KQK5_9RHOB|nr:DUF2927 domain-containing protein [Fertoeibacter niger]NUB46071.1 DUF2927 domain-containing protein [Fertoeibacter niger]